MLIAQIAEGAEKLATPGVDWGALLPFLILVGGACLLLVADALSLKRWPAGSYALITVAVAAGSIGSAIPLWHEVRDPDRGPFGILRNAVGVDGFSVFFVFVIGAAVILAALLADGYLRREDLEGSELYVLILLSASGGVVMAAANDLIVTFLGLEVLSIAVYVLAAMHLRRIESQEAGVKYFVLGAFSSAFFLYGIALIYGATGTTRLSGIASMQFGNFVGDEITTTDILSGGDPPALLLAGLALLVVGFGFKIAAVPFHSWTPDVYQGSPSPVVAFMASGVKAAGFAGLLRVLFEAFGAYADDWRPFVTALAIATLVVGAVLAVVQTDVKRLLAYSSINHAGFILLGVIAATERGNSAALFYLAAYTFMVAGSFGVVTVVSRRGDDATGIDDFRGLAKRRPFLAFGFTIFLLSQAGVPFTAGFWAKAEVLSAAVDADRWYVALVAMVSAVVAAFIYLRVVVSMYAADDEAEADAPEPRADVEGARVPFGARLALLAAAAVTLVVGFLPGVLADLSDDANPVADAPAQE